jgi:hypothetical protein
VNPSTMQVIGAIVFALALIHTFSTKYFGHLAHARPKHAELWHLLGEVEIVFGFWAMILMLTMFVLEGKEAVTGYLESRNFTEPMFVFAIMVIAGSRPILVLAESAVEKIGRLLPLGPNAGLYFCAMAILPLLGSFITEPATMTVAALVLRERFFKRGGSAKFKYATIGALFVNISIGGTLTPYAAPPIVMVAGKWGWDISFMIAHFGWKAALAVLINALAITLIFRRQLNELPPAETTPERRFAPVVTLVHLIFLTAVVVFGHAPHAFMGLFLFFLGFVSAYPKHQGPLILREGLLVAFFLAGLVVLGGHQRWWLQPLLMRMNETAIYFGATVMTAVIDNAALTYLASLVEGLSANFKYAIVAGAVTGGGLTVIANAPNPAGFSILKGHFPDGAISALWLLVAALPPTLIALIAFWVL